MSNRQKNEAEIIRRARSILGMRGYDSKTAVNTTRLYRLAQDREMTNDELAAAARSIANDTEDYL